MNQIAIFYHCLFVVGEPPEPLPFAWQIVAMQMRQLKISGLLDAASEFQVGVNGDTESEHFADAIIPRKGMVVYHGLESRSENPTLLMLEHWVKTHPGWNVLYIHSKGASLTKRDSYSTVSSLWREDMMVDLVANWKRCVADLENGNDVATSLWMWNMCDGTQHIPAGNFLWIKSDFAAKLPSLMLRDRIKHDGIGALSSRHEAECFWGNGPRPYVKSYREHGWPWNRVAVAA